MKNNLFKWISCRQKNVGNNCHLILFVKNLESKLFLITVYFINFKYSDLDYQKNCYQNQ